MIKANKNHLNKGELNMGNVTIRCKCEKCGYEWQARTKTPKACPKCKRYDWNKEKK